MNDPMNAAKFDAASLESNLRELWCRLLGRAEIGLDDDFFKLGGVSLQAIMTATWLMELYGDAVPADVVYKAPTIRALLDFCRQIG